MNALKAVEEPMFMSARRKFISIVKAIDQSGRAEAGWIYIYICLEKERDVDGLVACWRRRRRRKKTFFFLPFSFLVVIVCVCVCVCVDGGRKKGGGGEGSGGD